MPLDVNAFAAEVAHTITSALVPVLERLTAMETRLAYLGDLRDRVVTLEAKAAIPAPDLPTVPDLMPAVGALDTRIVVLETKAEAPAVNLTPALERLAALEARLDVLGDLRDRVVTMETKAAAAPPAGKDGRDGLDGKDGPAGKDGQDGAPGLGFEDLAVDYDGDRGVTFKFARGLQVKEFPLTLPMVIYRGVYADGRSYSVGDVVTWGGSAWHCQKATALKPEDGGAHWRLMVKRGNEGRAGRDGKDLLPVPVVGVGHGR